MKMNQAQHTKILQIEQDHKCRTAESVSFAIATLLLENNTNKTLGKEFHGRTLEIQASQLI